MTRKSQCYKIDVVLLSSKQHHIMGVFEQESVGKPLIISEQTVHLC